jgi:hypothetical protein
MSQISTNINLSQAFTLEIARDKLSALKNIQKGYIPKIDLYISIIHSCIQIQKGIVIDKYLDETNLKDIILEIYSTITLATDWINKSELIKQVTSMSQISSASSSLNSLNTLFKKNTSNSPSRDSSSPQKTSSVHNSSKSQSPRKKSITPEDEDDNTFFQKKINTRLEDIIKKLSLQISSEKPSENITIDDIQDIIFDSKAILPLYIDYNGPIEKPHDPLYGGDFKSKLITKFTLPNLRVNNKNFEGIEVNCNCIDQNWGGTGQCNIRYFVNDKWFGPAFYINRETSKDNNYTFIIKHENVKSGDKINIWLCCPGWNGWFAKLNSIEIKLKYY